MFIYLSETKIRGMKKWRNFALFSLTPFKNEYPLKRGGDKKNIKIASSQGHYKGGKGLMMCI